MSWQQGHEHAKASDGEVDVEQPGQQLEGVGGPAPAVSPRAERHVSSVWTVLTDRRRAVRVPTAHIHPAQSQREWSSSRELLYETHRSVLSFSSADTCNTDVSVKELRAATSVCISLSAAYCLDSTQPLYIQDEKLETVDNK